MESGRMPVCVVPPSRGPDNTNVPINVLTGADVSQKSGNTQVFVYGNRCGHDKNNFKVPPLFGKTKSGTRLPHSISECGKRLQYLASRIRGGISRKDINREKLKPTGMLQWFISLYDNPKFLGFLYHCHPLTPSRKRRSESLEAIIFITLGTIISRLNLYKMAYGFFDGANEFVYFDYARIAKESGISIIRVKRSMKILQASGFFKVIEIKKTLNDGKIINIATQIHATDVVFDFLGLMPEFLKDRETSAIRFHEKQSRLDNNKAKREFYRKKTFPDKKPSYLKKVAPSLQPSVQNCVKRVSAPQSGRGYAIKARMEQLKHQGFTPVQIMDFLKKEFPPPS